MAESKVRQGVTTEIIGHCGFSVAPALPGKVTVLKDYLSPSAPWLPFKEMSFPQYLDTFPATSVNAGMLVGHNTLRLMVMGMENRAPSAAELDAMIALLEDGLKAGALGMSSGLFTSPGSYAQPDEMIAFGHVLKKYNAGYFTHLRDESNKVIEALEEAIDVARQCGVHVEIVHFKCSGMDNWGKAATALKLIADARAHGLDVDCDAYPYAAGSNPLKNLLPQWVQAGGVDEMLKRLPQPETRARIRADIDRDGLNNWGRIPNWDCVQISISPNLPQHAGKTIAALAAERGADPIDALCQYLADDKGATRVLVTSISEDDIAEIVRDETALVGSDGNCVATTGTTSQGMPHPRFYGTFPRIIDHYVRARARGAARNRDPQDDRRDRQGAQAEGPRPAAGRLSRRRHDLRSGRLPRPRHLRRPAPVSDRRAHERDRQRRTGGGERRAYRRAAGTGVAKERERRGGMMAADCTLRPQSSPDRGSGQ